MNGDTVTMTTLMELGTFATGLLALWWQLESKIASGKKEAMKKADEAMQKSDDILEAISKFKLEVAENYARNTFIRDVEGRLAQRFDSVVSELHGLRKDLQDALVGFAAQKKSGRG